MNSKIYLAKNIKLDKNYKAVLNYSESNMLSLITNQSNLVYSEVNAQFVRDTNSIIVKGKYNVCIQANYMAFSNPDYSNKWFFAFIDEVKYKGENSTEIKYTIDVWSTWHDYWSAKACFVVREHVVDDTIGVNTVPEDIELGEYVVNDVETDSNLNTLSFIIQVSEWTNGTKIYATNYGGIFEAGGAYICTSIAEVVNIVESYIQNNKQDAILRVYTVPSKFINNTSGSLQYSGQTVPEEYNFTISKPTQLDNYTPVNKKLLQYPYCYLTLDNNNGVSNILYYEKFSTDPCIFKVKGVPSVGGSIKSVPKDYKGATAYEQEGILAGKFPTLSWTNDEYINWLTNNAVNLNIGVASSGAQVLGGLILTSTGYGAFAGVPMMISGATNIIQTMKQVEVHSKQPRSAEGNLNGGDINTCSNANVFYYIKMSITQEFARRCDAYFTRMGYKVNQVKVPNLGHRQNYNYVLVASDENVAFPNNYNNICLPATALDTINNLFRSGITIWNNHSNFGDYSVTNNIVS